MKYQMSFCTKTWYLLLLWLHNKSCCCSTSAWLFQGWGLGGEGYYSWNDTNLFKTANLRHAYIHTLLHTPPPPPPQPLELSCCSTLELQIILKWSMVWYIMGVYIIDRTLHDCNYITAVLTREYLSTLEGKFRISAGPCNNLYFIYLTCSCFVGLWIWLMAKFRMAV